jgi:hypothetical protein
MEHTIGEVGQNVSDTFLPDQKETSLKGQWFQIKREELVQQQGRTDEIGRNAIFVDAVGYYRVMSVYTKSNIKRRYKDHIDLRSKTKFLAHVHRIISSHEQLVDTTVYELKNNLDTYVGQG